MPTAASNKEFWRQRALAETSQGPSSSKPRLLPSAAGSSLAGKRMAEDDLRGKSSKRQEVSRSFQGQRIPKLTFVKARTPPPDPPLAFHNAPLPKPILKVVHKEPALASASTSKTSPPVTVTKPSKSLTPGLPQQQDTNKVTATPSTMVVVGNAPNPTQARTSLTSKIRLDRYHGLLSSDREDRADCQLGEEVHDLLEEADRKMKVSIIEDENNLDVLRQSETEVVLERRTGLYLKVIRKVYVEGELVAGVEDDEDEVSSIISENWGREYDEAAARWDNEKAHERRQWAREEERAREPSLDLEVRRDGLSRGMSRVRVLRDCEDPEWPKFGGDEYEEPEESEDDGKSTVNRWEFVKSKKGIHKVLRSTRQKVWARRPIIPSRSPSPDLTIIPAFRILTTRTSPPNRPSVVAPTFRGYMIDTKQKAKARKGDDDGESDIATGNGDEERDGEEKEEGEEEQEEEELQEEQDEQEEEEEQEEGGTNEDDEDAGGDNQALDPGLPPIPPATPLTALRSARRQDYFESDEEDYNGGFDSDVADNGPDPIYRTGKAFPHCGVGTGRPKVHERTKRPSRLLRDQRDLAKRAARAAEQNT